MNRDESLRCFEVAKGYYNSGEYEQALKFFNKSYHLERSDLTLQYMKKCQEQIRQGNSSSHANGSSSNPSHPREGMTRSAPASSQSNEPVSEDIKKLLSQKDFYELLGVEKLSTDDEIKKAYRKLALKYHPDKNKAHKSDEAFKKIAQAYDCLSNAEKRQKYDEYGNEEPEQHFRHYRQYYSEEVSPQDIFEMFFGSAMGGRTRMYYKRPPQGSSGGNRQQSPMASFLQFLPFILIFGSSIIFNLAREEPIYSMTQTAGFPIQRFTTDMHYPYYVEKDFEKVVFNNLKKLRDVEREVEVKTIKMYEDSCMNARWTKRQHQQSARWYREGDQRRTEYLQKAESVDQTSCDAFEAAYKAKPALFNSYYH